MTDKRISIWIAIIGVLVAFLGPLGGVFLYFEVFFMTRAKEKILEDASLKAVIAEEVREVVKDNGHMLRNSVDADSIVSEMILHLQTTPSSLDRISQHVENKLSRDEDFENRVVQGLALSIKNDQDLQKILEGPPGPTRLQSIVNKGFSKEEGYKLGSPIQVVAGGVLSVYAKYPEGESEIDATLVCELWVGEQFDRILATESIYRAAGSKRAVSSTIKGILPHPQGDQSDPKNKVEWVVKLEGNQDVMPQLDIYWAAIK